MTDHHAHLAAAVASLYDAFARYPLQHPIPGCECCVFPEDQVPLTRSPLRALSSDALEKFGNKAMTTWGGVDDFRHFLPRLLELEACGPIVTLVRLSEKLTYASWRTWPTPEQDAVATYYQSLATSLLTPLASDRLLREVLEDAVMLGIDMTPFLADWGRRKGETRAMSQLARLVAGLDATSFWHALGPHAPHAGSIAWRQLRAWLLDPSTEDALVEAYVTGNAGSTAYDERQLAEIATAADQIAMLRDHLGPAP